MQTLIILYPSVILILFSNVNGDAGMVTVPKWSCTSCTTYDDNFFNEYCFFDPMYSAQSDLLAGTVSCFISPSQATDLNWQGHLIYKYDWHLTKSNWPGWLAKMGVWSNVSDLRCLPLQQIQIQLTFDKVQLAGVICKNRTVVKCVGLKVPLQTSLYAFLRSIKRSMWII